MKKKIFAYVAIALVMAMCLVGCKKKTECDGCGEVKKCDQYEFDGEKVWMCDDCHDTLEALNNLLN